MSLSRIIKSMKGKEGKIAVCVCNILDDKRILEIPKLKICALKFSESARKRILASGGSCYTFDQLALKCPFGSFLLSPSYSSKGSNTVLLRGPKSREALKHFGLAPGQKGSHSKYFLFLALLYPSLDLTLDAKKEKKTNKPLLSTSSVCFFHFSSFYAFFAFSLLLK